MAAFEDDIDDFLPESWRYPTLSSTFIDFFNHEFLDIGLIVSGLDFDVWLRSEEVSGFGIRPTRDEDLEWFLAFDMRRSIALTRSQRDSCSHSSRASSMGVVLE